MARAHRALADVIAAPAARVRPIAVLVERHRHHSIGRIERLLHAIAMEHIDVDIQHPRVITQQLQDREHCVVDVAVATGLRGARVVHASRPVDGNVRIGAIELDRRRDAAARVDLDVPAQ